MSSIPLPKHPRFINLTGHKYGRLTVVSYAGMRGASTNAFWKCECTCGSEVTVNSGKLRSGHTQSCGCRRIIHAGSQRGMLKGWFTAYHSMRARCLNPKSTHYHNYGGRGITICDRWLHSSSAFFEDMGDRPKGKTLERIDTEKGYSPENCVWASHTDQNRNKRDTVFTIDQVKRIRAMRRAGISRSKAYAIMNPCTPIDSAFSSVWYKKTWKDVS